MRVGSADDERRFCIDRVDSAYSAPPTQSLDSPSDSELVIEGTNVSRMLSKVVHCSVVKTSLSGGEGRGLSNVAASIDMAG